MFYPKCIPSQFVSEDWQDDQKTYSAAFIYIFSINYYYYYVQCFIQIIQNQDDPSKIKLIHIQAKKKLVIKIGLVDRKDPYRNVKNDWSQDESLWPELDYFDIS